MTICYKTLAAKLRDGPRTDRGRVEHYAAELAAELLIKEGFPSMEALALVDEDDLTHTKVPRGQQKLLMKAVVPVRPPGTGAVGEEVRRVAETNMAATAMCEDGTDRQSERHGSRRRQRTETCTPA